MRVVDYHSRVRVAEDVLQSAKVELAEAMRKCREAEDYVFRAENALRWAKEDLADSMKVRAK